MFPSLLNLNSPQSPVTECSVVTVMLIKRGDSTEQIWWSSGSKLLPTSEPSLCLLSCSEAQGHYISQCFISQGRDLMELKLEQSLPEYTHMLKVRTSFSRVHKCTLTTPAMGEAITHTQLPVESRCKSHQCWALKDTTALHCECSGLQCCL